MNKAEAEQKMEILDQRIIARKGELRDIESKLKPLLKERAKLAKQIDSGAFPPGRIPPKDCGSCEHAWGDRCAAGMRKKIDEDDAICNVPGRPIKGCYGHPRGCGGCKECRQPHDPVEEERTRGFERYP